MFEFIIKHTTLNIFLLANISATLIVLTSFKYKILTKSGAIAAFFLGSFIFTFGQIKWSLPLLTFFISSTILSLVKKKNNNCINIKNQQNPRNIKQVFSNGFIPLIILFFNLLTGNEFFYILFIGSLAAVCADTWATEFGTMKENITYNLKTFKRVDPGLSGNVSIQGFIGSIFGGFVLSLSGVYWVQENIFSYFYIIIFVGFLSSLFDSILGAFFQEKYFCNICKNIIEDNFHCEASSNLKSGYKIITNDTVNFCTSLFGSILTYFFI